MLRVLGYLIRFFSVSTGNQDLYTVDVNRSAPYYIALKHKWQNYTTIVQNINKGHGHPSINQPRSLPLNLTQTELVIPSQALLLCIETCESDTHYLNGTVVALPLSPVWVVGSNPS